MREKIRSIWPQYWPDSNAAQSAIVSAAIVALLGLLTSAVYARAVANGAKQNYSNRQTQQIQALNSAISSKINNYEQTLLAASTLLSLDKDTITQTDWNGFVNGTQLHQRYPFTLGIGFARYLKPDQVADFEAAMQAQGVNGYAVRPATPRSEYTAVTFIEPDNEANRRSLGYDMLSDPTRGTAIRESIDEAQIVMSKPVKLVEDIESNNASKYGMYLYYPVYASVVPPATVDARLSELLGFVFVVMHPSDIIAAIASQQQSTKNSQFTVTDVTDSAPIRLFSNTNAREHTTSTQINAAGRKWDIDLASSNNIAAQIITPFLVFFTGMLMSALATYAVWRITLRRLSRVEEGYETEIQRTKDELLALASHQLRTPASGVKQYIGMLTQGYVGELTPEQQQIAEKAYTANERQLEIINELLYVAKADAGQLIMQPEVFNLTELVRDTLASVEEKAVQKDIILTYRTKKPLLVHADQGYVRMIIENLLTNAIKYSYASSRVTVSLRHDSSKVYLSVTDVGVGMENEDIPRIFDKFKRVENPLSRAEGGSGLGLFLARELAYAHRGDIHVKSELDTGSTFTLILPYNQKKINRDHSLAKLGKVHRDDKQPNRLQSKH